MGLQELTMGIFKQCVRQDIMLNIIWIPRELNKHADDISRMLEADDFSVSRKRFLELNALWGLYTIDFTKCTNAMFQLSIHDPRE